MRTRFFSALILGFLLATVGPTVGWSQAPPQAAHPARPGSINYVEGTAAIGTQELGADSPGSVELEQGQTLTTKAGKVEVLLTPGIFLRVADDSSVKMVSPGLADTEVAVETGSALVEVLDIHKENNVRISLGDASAKLLDKGLYDFDAGQDEIRVFKGKADVYDGSQKITLKNEHELALNAAGKLKAQSFDTRKYEDDFFRWSALRSGYLSEASVDDARVYVGAGPGWYGPGWNGPGWYWDPNFLVYTFLPGDGIFYSPFGWGFYSPIVVYRSPFFYRGFYGPGIHRFGDLHYPYGHGFEPRGGFRGGGFHVPAARGGGRR